MCSSIYILIPYDKRVKTSLDGSSFSPFLVFFIDLSLILNDNIVLHFYINDIGLLHWPYLYPQWHCPANFVTRHQDSRTTLKYNLSTYCFLLPEIWFSSIHESSESWDVKILQGRWVKRQVVCIDDCTMACHFPFTYNN